MFILQVRVANRVCLGLFKVKELHHVALKGPCADHMAGGGD